MGEFLKVSLSRGIRVSLISPKRKSKLKMLLFFTRLLKPMYLGSFTYPRFTAAVRPFCPATMFTPVRAPADTPITPSHRRPSSIIRSVTPAENRHLRDPPSRAKAFLLISKLSFRSFFNCYFTPYGPKFQVDFAAPKC